MIHPGHTQSLAGLEPRTGLIDWSVAGHSGTWYEMDMVIHGEEGGLIAQRSRTVGDLVDHWPDAQVKATQGTSYNGIANDPSHGVPHRTWSGVSDCDVQMSKVAGPGVRS